MAAAEKPNVDECSLCGNKRRSARCKCPWHMPFQQWPKDLLSVVKDRCPNGFDPDPPLGDR